MSDDYLWDRSGEPDPEVQRLELLLGRFRSREPVPEIHVLSSHVDHRPFRALWKALAAIAAMTIFALGPWLLIRKSLPTWEVATLEGAPEIDSGRIGGTGHLTMGQWLETDATSRALLNIGEIGQAEIEPNTRLRLLATRVTEHRIDLLRGTLHATIWAPPRLFFVDTPSATAVDLGCAYTLTVDVTGASLLRVTYGWVAFDFHGHESIAPEGALCATRPGVGPGTPYFEDSSQTFQRALTRLDFGRLAPPDRSEALSTVLEEARPRDVLTLWHLLSRVDASERESVYNRMAKLVPPPAGVNRNGILHLDRNMLDLWWDQLGLGETSWLRMWKGSWPGPLK